MPDLYHSLLNYDLGHLRIVAECWGIELKSAAADQVTKELPAALLDPKLFTELIDSLAPEVRAALISLKDAGGRAPRPEFTRRYGDIREIGAAKRDREKPHLRPNSAAEVLFYRALLAHAFFDTEEGPQEFAYIPDDLMDLIQRAGTPRTGKENKMARGPGVSVVESESVGREAAPGERAQVI